MNDTLQSFLENGAGVVERVFSGEYLDTLREFCRGQVIGYTPKDSSYDSPAAPVSPEQPIFLEAIQRGAKILEIFGFGDIRFHSGALIPKWRNEERRGWHIDGWWWENSPNAWSEVPPQIGLLCYLDGTRLDTGALIIIPGSHRREIAGHYEFWETRKPHPDEVCIPVSVGDAILLDPRCMHAVTSNTAIDNRLCLTLWFMVDFEKLDQRIRATVMLSIPDAFKSLLGELCPSYDGPEKYFPHAKKPQFPVTFERISALKCGLTDHQIIGEARQLGDDFIDQYETYTWYRAIACTSAPRKILELGVRYGYSGVALLQGARWTGIDPMYMGIDGEMDGIESNEKAKSNLYEYGLSSDSTCCNSDGRERIRILKLDTRNTDEANAAVNEFGICDIIHIDGDHSIEGIESEINIAKMWISPRGLILIDDTDTPHIRSAADHLCAEYKITPMEIPTQHTLYLIDMRKRMRFV